MRRVLALLIAALTVLMAAQDGLVAADEISGELVGLNVSLAAEKQLVVHDQLVAAEDWSASLDLLDRLRNGAGGEFVKVAPGRFVGLPVAIQQKFCRLPTGGQAVYRKRSHTVASSLLSRARGEHDEAALWRIVEEFSATSVAPLAIQNLAALAAERGDLELSLRLWGRLIKTQTVEPLIVPPSMLPLTSTETEVIQIALLKILIARHFVGVPLTEEQRSRVGLDELDNGKFAGRPVRDLLTVTSASPESATLGNIRWTTVATENCPLTEWQTPLSVQWRQGGLLLLNNGQQIRALNTGTGEPFWSTGLPNDVGVVFDAPLIRDLSSREFPCRISGGVRTSDRYFGVIGDAPRWRPRPGLVPLSGSLLALDTDQGQGRVLWQIESRNLPEPEWQFHGQPVLSQGAWPSDDLVLVPLCRPTPQVELAVAAFSQDDGHLVWWSRIGTCAAEPGEPLPQTQLLAKGGLVIARTLRGVLVALEARHGTFHWASTAMVSSPPAQSGSHAALIDCRAGVLVAADPLQSRVTAFSLDSGEVLWQQSLEFPVQGVVCASPGMVLIAGTRLRAVSLLTGTPRWESGSDDLAAAGTGVPVVEGPTVYWPTRSTLWGLDLNTGAIESQRMLSTGPIAVPMQLSFSDSHWLLSLPDAILWGQRFSFAAPH